VFGHGGTKRARAAALGFAMGDGKTTAALPSVVGTE
jgi:hypothetical protein